MMTVKMVSNVLMELVQKNAYLVTIVNMAIIVTLIIKCVMKNVQLILIVLEDTHVLRMNVCYIVVCPSIASPISIVTGILNTVSFKLFKLSHCFEKYYVHYHLQLKFGMLGKLPQ